MFFIDTIYDPDTITLFWQAAGLTRTRDLEHE